MPTPWLPFTALGDARTAEPVARALADWCSDWLATGALSTAARWERCDTPAGTTGYRTVAQAKTCRLMVREEVRLELAGLLLGREITERECRARRDVEVIDHLVDAALAALGERLGQFGAGVRSPEDGDPGEWFVLPIDIAGGITAIRFEAARPVLVALARAWSGAPRDTAPLPGRRTSLAEQPIVLSARIGTSSLALAEVEALEIGDVLVLDTPISGAFAACIDGKPAGGSALSLAPADHKLELQIERPASQW